MCGCNSGRSRMTGAASTVLVIWRHTLPNGGSVDYLDQATAERAHGVQGGTLAAIDPATNAPFAGPVPAVTTAPIP